VHSRYPEVFSSYISALVCRHEDLQARKEATTRSEAHEFFQLTGAEDLGTPHPHLAS
jgi:hypothetical protein